MISSNAGGAIFPIMLPRLFSLVGFGWAVRISGFLCLACCALALASITRRRASATSAIQPQTTRRWFDLTSLKDARFVFLTAGSALISFGELELKNIHGFRCHCSANWRVSYLQAYLSLISISRLTPYPSAMPRPRPGPHFPPLSQ